MNQCQELIDAVKAGDIEASRGILSRRPMAIKTQEAVTDYSVIHVAVINRDYAMLDFLRQQKYVDFEMVDAPYAV